MTARGDNRVEAIIERGLDKYGGGDLLGAINEWEHALQIDPANGRAQEYIRYVRDNFEQLHRQWDEAHRVERQAAAQGVPVVDVPDDPDAYEAMVVESESEGYDGWSVDELGDRVYEPLELEDTDLVADESSLEADLAAVSAGLEAAAQEPLLDDPAQDAPPEYEYSARFDDRGQEQMEVGELESAETLRPASDDPWSRAEITPTPGMRMPLVTIKPRSGEGTSPGALPAPPQAAEIPDLDLDLRAPESTGAGLSLLGLAPLETDPAYSDEGAEEDTAESTRPRLPSQGFADDAPTHERRAAPALDGIDLGNEDDFLGERETKEREPFSDAPTPPPAAPPAKPGAPAVIIDEQLLRAYDDIGELIGPDSATPRAGETALGGDDVVRRRVGELIKLAHDAAEQGDFRAAVDAAEAAAAEDPDGLVAPMLLHRAEDLLQRIYAGHLGDLRQVPLVAVPLHEISAQHLDHKTGFLLSRIDGMLTFDDILDVCGMPRMDAYKILSRLLRTGMIEVR